MTISYKEKNLNKLLNNMFSCFSKFTKTSFSICSFFNMHSFIGLRIFLYSSLQLSNTSIMINASSIFSISSPE